MSDLLARAGSVFLAPSAPAPVALRSPAPPPDLVGVLAAPRDLAAVAGGVAADLRRRHRTRAALVCGPFELVAAHPSTRAARTIATRLMARDLTCAAAGVLCRVALPTDPEEAVRVAWRAVACAAGYPAVVALVTRDDATDALLAQADLLLVAEPPENAYGELALASLTTLGPPATAVRLPAGFLARRAAAHGLMAVTITPDVVAA